MKDIPETLPRVEVLDVGALARTLDGSNVTTSYKYLLMISLLELVQERNFQKHRVGFDELLAKMLTVAWLPARHCRLSFGVQDKVGEVLRHLDDAELCERFTFGETVVKQVEQAIKWGLGDGTFSEADKLLRL